MIIILTKTGRTRVNLNFDYRTFGKAAPGLELFHSNNGETVLEAF